MKKQDKEESLSEKICNGLDFPLLRGEDVKEAVKDILEYVDDERNGRLDLIIKIKKRVGDKLTKWQ